MRFHKPMNKCIVLNRFYAKKMLDDDNDGIDQDHDYLWQTFISPILNVYYKIFPHSQDKIEPYTKFTGDIQMYLSATRKPYRRPRMQYVLLFLALGFLICYFNWENYKSDYTVLSKIYKFMAYIQFFVFEYLVYYIAYALYFVKAPFVQLRDNLLSFWFGYYEINDILLPPPEYTADQPYTLIIDADMLYEDPPMVKRNGLDFFLAEASKYCEIITIHDTNAVTASGDLEEIDDGVYISYCLGHDLLDIHRNNFWPRINPPVPYLVELRRLNRDPRKVLVITSNRIIYAKCLDNVVPLTESQALWWDASDDSVLYDLIPIIQSIKLAVKEGIDIREEIKKYKGIDIVNVVKQARREGYENFSKGNLRSRSE